MKSFVLLFALVLQQPPRWEGTLAQGLERMQVLAKDGQQAEALALSEQLLAGRTVRECAAVEYARGVLHASAGEREPAAESFQRARSDGSGALRLAAMYNLGTLALEQGEEWYHKLPEVSGKPAPAQPPAGAAAPGQPPGPDALAEARKGYVAARERLLERLRAQWDDPDTRANVELVQRRLKRLDEIEKQRKEEQQKQQQKQDSKNDQKQQDKQDKPDPGKPKDDPEKQDPQEQQQPAQDPQDKDKPEEQKPDQPKPEDQKQPGEKEQPQPKPAEEQQLSKEEMTRLLDKLQQLEEQAAKLRAQIHKARRVAVKKDW